MYHLHAKPVARSSGRSATAAAAYRAGESITDLRTGEVFDFTRKMGVLHTQMILPDGGTTDRAEFWNKVEAHHKRGDAVVAREIELSLPRELTLEQRQELAVRYAAELTERYGVAADVCLHEPNTVTDQDLEKDPEKYWEIDPLTGRRHNANWHAHILLSACSVSPNGALGKKVVEMDPIHCQRMKIKNMVEYERERWADLGGAALELGEFYVEAARFRAGHTTLEKQVNAARERGDLEFVHANENRAPQKHLGPSASAFERRTGEASRKRIDFERDTLERLSAAKMIGELERQEQELSRSIIDLSNDLSAATLARDREAAKKGSHTASVAINRIREIKSRHLTKGAEINGNERKSSAGIWTPGQPQGSFETYELDAFSNQSIFETKSIDDLRDLSSIDVVPGRSRGQVLLSGDALDQLAERKSNAVEALRWSVADQRGIKQGGSAVQRLKRQLLMGTEETPASNVSANADSISRESLGQFFVEQLTKADQAFQEQQEHERPKPLSPQ
jgi:hypothetical protein